DLVDDLLEEVTFEALLDVEAANLLPLDPWNRRDVAVLASALGAEEIAARRRGRVGDRGHRRGLGEACGDPRRQRHPRAAARAGDAEDDAERVHEAVL